jgi:hypothetical protein
LHRVPRRSARSTAPARSFSSKSFRTFSPMHEHCDGLLPHLIDLWDSAAFRTAAPTVPCTIHGFEPSTTFETPGCSPRYKARSRLLAAVCCGLRAAL